MENVSKNSVYIATSLDGYIADKAGNIDWLYTVPNPEHDDMGFADFIGSIDALIMGRNTFETVCSFDVEWPYPCPVFVLSNSLTAIPAPFNDKVKLINGNLKDVVKKLNANGFHHLYIDGGSTIQSFLKEDLIDELIISTIPILLGGGVPLFGSHETPLKLELISSKVALDAIVQTHYKVIH